VIRNLFLLLLLLPVPPKHYRIKTVLGNTGSMVRQNQEIDHLNLPRIVNNEQLHQLISQGELVRIPENETLTTTISEDRKYVRPWVRYFIQDMAAGFFSNFNKPLVIDSAVRTVEQQAKLIRTNRFAAPAYGILPSSHLAGITVDIAKRRYSPKERRWIVSYLKSMKDKGLIEAVEEPVCFHVMVREMYNEINFISSDVSNTD
jgi:hypothetical protein